MNKIDQVYIEWSMAFEVKEYWFSTLHWEHISLSNQILDRQ